jgi:hypothetical protein
MGDAGKASVFRRGEAMTITDLKQSIALLETHLSKGCCRNTVRKADCRIEIRNRESQQGNEVTYRSPPAAFHR